MICLFNLENPNYYHYYYKTLSEEKLKLKRIKKNI